MRRTLLHNFPIPCCFYLFFCLFFSLSQLLYSLHSLELLRTNPIFLNFYCSDRPVLVQHFVTVFVVFVVNEVDAGHIVVRVQKVKTQVAVPPHLNKPLFTLCLPIIKSVILKAVIYLNYLKVISPKASLAEHIWTWMKYLLQAMKFWRAKSLDKSMTTRENMTCTWPFPLQVLRDRSPGGSAVSWRWLASGVPKISYTLYLPCSPATSWRCQVYGADNFCFELYGIIWLIQRCFLLTRRNLCFPWTCTAQLNITFILL